MNTANLIRQKIKALNGARYELENGTAVALCMALHNTLNGYPLNVNPGIDPSNETYKLAVQQLVLYVRKSLGTHAYLGSWLRERDERSYGYAELYMARISWIEWMCLCLKEDLEKLG